MSAVVPSRMVMLGAGSITRVYREVPRRVSPEEFGSSIRFVEAPLPGYESQSPHPNVAKNATLGWGTLKSLFVGFFFGQFDFSGVKLLLHLGERV